MDRLSTARTQFHLALGSIFIPFVGILVTLGLAFVNLGAAQPPAVRRWGFWLFALAIFDALLLGGLAASGAFEAVERTQVEVEARASQEQERGSGLFTPEPDAHCGPFEQGVRFPWGLVGAAGVVAGLQWLGRRRGMDSTLAWAGGLLLAVALLTQAVTLATCAWVGGPAPGVLLVGVAAQTVVLLLGGVILYRRSRPELRTSEDLPVRPGSIAVALGAWYLLTGGFRVGGLLLLVSRLIGADSSAVAEAPLQNVATSDLGPLGIVLFVVPVAVLAPLSEELLFRGIVLPWFSRWMPVWAAIVLSAAIFGALHFHYGLFLGVTVFYGVVLGWARVSSRSLRAPVLLHMLINGLGSLVLLSR